MPFASLNRPSIALTQLKAGVEGRFGTQVAVRIVHLNLELGRYRPELYPLIAETAEATGSGAGDWFFRHLAFPSAADNTDAYMRRYFRPRGAQAETMFQLALAKRRGLGALLDHFIDLYDLAAADLTGFTSMFSQNVACFALARQLKQRRSAMVTVIGGANCETPMGQVIARLVPEIDYVFSGPALCSFPEAVGCLMAGQPHRIDALNGVFSRRRLAAGRLDAARASVTSSVWRSMCRSTTTTSSPTSSASCRTATRSRACCSRPRGAAGGASARIAPSTGSTA